MSNIIARNADVGFRREVPATCPFGRWLRKSIYRLIHLQVPNEQKEVDTQETRHRPISDTNEAERSEDHDADRVRLQHGKITG